MIAPTDLPLVGVMVFVGTSGAVMAAIMTVVLGSGAHDEALLGGGHHYSRPWWRLRREGI